MQGKKHYQEKFFVSFRLSERVPESNFYRRLKEAFDLGYLRLLTKRYYGSEGQKSIDPVVFFKLMLVGYLENICSDRKIIEQSSMRMDILYFLGYDIDEPLPWHSTLSRTRKLFGEEVFLSFFRDILRMCVEKGMVAGKTQAVDSAFIKANASRDSLVEKELSINSKKYFDDITANESPCASEEKAAKSKKSSNFNKRHISKTDPDARLSRKSGKPYALNHLGIISVDTASHIICGAAVDFADKGDSHTTENIVGQTLDNLRENSIEVNEVLADSSYSSGETYKYLEEQGITAYIPVRSSYKAEKEGFSYDEKSDCFVCKAGSKLTYRGIRQQDGRETFEKIYGSSAEHCRDCPFKPQCSPNRSSKRVAVPFYRHYYDAAYERMKTFEGKQKKRRRMATVEPVWGTLLNFMRMKKVYTIGNALAHKQLLMAAATYNLKKLMLFKGIKSMANAAKGIAVKIKEGFLEKILIYKVRII
jgi:transposase